MPSHPIMRPGKNAGRTLASPNPNPHPELAEKAARWYAAQQARANADNPPSPDSDSLVVSLDASSQAAELLEMDPSVNTREAASILGRSYECLKKWRQRDQGPEYFQDVPGGAVLYSVRKLHEFRRRAHIRPAKYVRRAR